MLIICIVILISIFFLLFLYKPFGGIPTKKDMDDYSKRASNFINKRFKIDDYSFYTKWVDIYKNITTNKQVVPKNKLSLIPYKYKKAKIDEVFVTWFGHSSILLQMHCMNIFLDPVFSKRTSPFPFIGPKRFTQVPNIEEFPDIDIVLITHDHYDHLDYNTIKKIDSKVKKYIVPLGIEKDLEKFGIDKTKIMNMAWWEEININGLNICCTPTKHFAGRFFLDSNKTLCCSYILKDEYNTIYDSGDTGYGKHFKDIEKKYKSISLALLDTAQYSTRWHDSHMFPEECVQASIDLKAEITFPIHWGAYSLSNHPWDTPIHRFIKDAKKNDIEYVTPKLGQTIDIKKYKMYKDMWWKDIK